MINHFTTKIKTFLDHRVKEVKKHQELTQQTALDYAQIAKLFPEASFIPFTTWSLSPSAILHILNDIAINDRHNIIEFGAGASTLYIARLMQTLELNGTFISLDSDEEWIAKMKKKLLLYNLDGWVTFIHAPLTTAPKEICFKEQSLWYDVGAINRVLDAVPEIDLVIVDGPYGGSTPFARYSALPFLKPRLSKNFAVFLDDVRRAEEEEIVRQWAALLELPVNHRQRYAYFTTDHKFITAPYKVSKS